MRRDVHHRVGDLTAPEGGKGLEQAVEDEVWLANWGRKTKESQANARSGTILGDNGVDSRDDTGSEGRESGLHADLDGLHLQTKLDQLLS